MNIWNELLSNQVLVSAVVGWTVAQVLKTMIDFALNRSINWERMVGSGGMPSSHSATVCGLTTAAAIRYGVGSFEFAVCFVLSMVVMYDATGVRRETGQAGQTAQFYPDGEPLEAQRGGAAGEVKGVRGPHAASGGGRGHSGDWTGACD